MTPAVCSILGLPEPVDDLPKSVLSYLAKTLGLKEALMGMAQALPHDFSTAVCTLGLSVLIGDG